MFRTDRLMLLNGCELRSFYQERLLKSSLDKAETEFGETTARKREALSEMKLLLGGDRVTNRIEFEDDFVVQYLRHTKYDVKRAFHLLRVFISVRKNHEYIFSTVPDEYFFTIPSTKYIHMLPWRCPSGCAIAICAPGYSDPGELSLDNFKRLAVLVYDQALRDPMNQIHGFKVIFDFKHLGLKHLRFCTPSHIHLFYEIGLVSIPARYKEVYIVNQSSGFKLIWTIIKHLLSVKLRNRILFLDKADDVTKFLPREIVPPRYGGDLKGYDPADWLRRMNMQHGELGMGGQKNYY